MRVSFVLLFLLFFSSFHAHSFMLPSPIGIRLSLEENHNAILTVQETLGDFVRDNKITMFKQSSMEDKQTFCVFFESTNFREEFSRFINQIIDFPSQKERVKYLWTKEQFERCL